MILSVLITGAAIIAGTTLIAKYWNNIIDWLKRAITKVQSLIKGIVYGTKVFIQKTKEGIKEISKHYSQDENGRWKETLVSREIPASEVPEEILKKAKYMNEMLDITDELELQLS